MAKTAKPLVDYIYVEESVLNNYLSQIPITKAWRLNFDWSFSLSKSGPSLELSPQALDQESVHKKLTRLIDFLIVNNMLYGRRPFSLRDPRLEGHFVLEELTATRVVFPPERLAAIPGLQQFAVWVSDPDPNDFTDEEWKWHGTFLFLTEVYWDTAGSKTTFSGCSALQAIMNTLEGKNLLTPNWEEPFGRWSNRHPLDKLRAVGGLVGVPQRIMSLYRMRYMTDEQCYIVDGRERRVHDLLGYPVSIARL